MVGDFAPCWWCRNAVRVEELHRLDNVESLAGNKPGSPKSGMRNRVCSDCLITWATLRDRRNKDIADVSGLSE